MEQTITATAPAGEEGTSQDAPMQSLSERFREHRHRLQKNGVTPSTQPPPVYICPACRDIGFVHPRDERGNVDYSRVIPCPAPGCSGHRAERARLGERVAMARGVNRPCQSFESFQPVDGAKQALSYARSLAEGTAATFIWLLIYGGTGNGKSHLCNAMARAAIRRGVDTRLVAVADLFSGLRSAVEVPTCESMMQRYKQTGFLVLDDYGVQYGTDWEAARFDELMTFRYANLLPTAMTTNLDLTDLPERIRSRFEDRTLARIAHDSARDYRRG